MLLQTAVGRGVEYGGLRWVVFDDSGLQWLLGITGMMRWVPADLSGPK